MSMSHICVYDEKKRNEREWLIMTLNDCFLLSFTSIEQEETRKEKERSLCLLLTMI